MHGIPEWVFWLLWLSERWYWTAPLTAYVIGVLVMSFVWRSVRIGLLWPVFIVIYRGPQ